VFVSQFLEVVGGDFFARKLTIPLNQLRLALAVSSVAARKLALLVVITPTKPRLMNTPAGVATAETRRMIERWGVLHAGRSALGVIATLIFLRVEQ
jgi:hypothetical protein